MTTANIASDVRTTRRGVPKKRVIIAGRRHRQREFHARGAARLDPDGVDALTDPLVPGADLVAARRHVVQRKSAVG